MPESQVVKIKLKMRPDLAETCRERLELHRLLKTQHQIIAPHSEVLPWRQYLACLSALLTMVCAGTVYGWLRYTELVIVDDEANVIVQANDLATALLDACGWIGASLAPMAGIMVISAKGRRAGLIVTCYYFVLGWMGIYFKYVQLSIFARLFLGMGVGSAFVICPIYVSEVADRNTRSVMAVLNTMAFLFGCLLSRCILIFEHSLDNIVLLLALLAFIAHTAITWFPETPKFLMMKGYYQEALLTYVLFRPWDYTYRGEIQDESEESEELRVVEVFPKNKEKELKNENEPIKSEKEEIMSEKEKMKSEKEDIKDEKEEVKSEKEKLKSDIELMEKERQKLMEDEIPEGQIACGTIYILLIIAQQLSCIFYPMQYLEDQFTGVPDFSTHGSYIMVMFVSLLGCTIGAIMVSTVNRKPLLLVSTFLYSASLIVIGVYELCRDKGMDLDYLGNINTMSAAAGIMAYYVGLGVLPFVLLNELLNTRVRPAFNTISYMMTPLINYMLASQVQILSVLFNPHYLFFFPAGFTLFAFIIILFYLPETRGKTYRELTAQYACLETRSELTGR